MKNKYEIRGDIVAVFLNHLGNTIETLIDTEDLRKLESYPYTLQANWQPKKQMYRVTAPIKENGNKKYTFLHRLILNALPGTEVDHINGNTLDNRKSNLNLTDKQGNMQNRTGPEARNKSGIRNVSWDKEKNKWAVYIKVNKKTRFIGRYDCIKEAERAAIKARTEYMPNSREGLMNAQ